VEPADLVEVPGDVADEEDLASARQPGVDELAARGVAGRVLGYLNGPAPGFPPHGRSGYHIHTGARRTHKSHVFACQLDAARRIVRPEGKSNAIEAG
jgi:hypothetical protein